jgi:hypothetical protein
VVSATPQPRGVWRKNVGEPADFKILRMRFSKRLSARNWIKNYWVWPQITERFATGRAIAQASRDAQRLASRRFLLTSSITPRSGIRRGTAFGFLGIVTVSTPSFPVASTLSLSTVSGNTKRR